jgi:hypothetical protein
LTNSHDPTLEMDMSRLNFVTRALASALGAVPVVLAMPANAQVGVQMGIAPPPPTVPRSGLYSDRDRDGAPNCYDTYDNRRAWSDRDHDGVPGAYDRYDNRIAGDRAGDGVPNRYDSAE